MAIHLNNFVKIQIDYHESTDVTGIRDTAILLDTKNEITSIVGTNNIISNLQDLSDFSSTDVYQYANVFFTNGGKKLHIINTGSTISTTDSAITAIKNNSNYTEILIAATGTLDMKELATKILADDYFKDENEKIIVGNINTSTLSDGLDNYAVKYLPSGTSGLEMTILAYFTKSNFYTSQIEDYAFTQEKYYDINGNDKTNEISITDNDIVESCIKNNINVLGHLTGTNLNIGGNTTSGKDLSNYFTKILLAQTVAENLVELLKTKIRYNQSGLNLISNTLVSELNKYRDNGYLTTDKVWKDQDFKVGNYTIISKGTRLNVGYKFFIAPLSTLTDEEIKQHKLPIIYLFIADSYSIRKIEIVGQVI